MGAADLDKLGICSGICFGYDAGSYCNRGVCDSFMDQKQRVEGFPSGRGKHAAVFDIYGALLYVPYGDPVYSCLAVTNGYYDYTRGLAFCTDLF